MQGFWSISLSAGFGLFAGLPIVSGFFLPYGVGRADSNRRSFLASGTTAERRCARL